MAGESVREHCCFRLRVLGEPLEVHLPSESAASGSGREEKARVLEEDVRKHGFWKRIFIAVRKQRFSSERAAPRTNFWSLFVWN